MATLDNHQSNDYVKLRVEDVAYHYNRPIVVNEEGCWLWLGGVDKRGYARYSSSLVYGVVWRMAGFECPDGEELCHKCNNKNCINPDHIYSGTHLQNMKDASDAGVMGVKGRITLEQISIAREMLLSGAMKKDVAIFLGVSRQWISDARAGRYKYVNLG